MTWLVRCAHGPPSSPPKNPSILTYRVWGLEHDLLVDALMVRHHPPPTRRRS